MKNIIYILTIALLMFSCGENNSDNATENNDTKNVSITAAGATFPLPFYNLSFKKYTKSEGTLLTYGGIGSGGGIRSLKDKVVDFGATDAFLNEEKEAAMPAKIVHIPTCIGAVVIAFNLPDIETKN